MIGEYPDLYSNADVAWLHDQTLQFEVLDLAPDIEPDGIDPVYWGIDPTAWALLSPEQKQAMAATFIVEDRWAMRWAGVEPDEWEQMPLDEREEILRAERAARA